MEQTIVPLAVHLQELYSSGMTVGAIAAVTGLPEPAVLVRLRAASRLRRPVYRDYRIRWEFVSGRN